MTCLLRVFALALCALSVASRAHADTVLSFKFTPAPRAQLAIWIEDSAGHYLRAAALTEAVAYRGIGNRPGASEMNSGYRWPYGRREGALPIWAHRRASAAGAKLFPRVIFQSRVEGHASRSTNDQSPDSYYCLQFDSSKSNRDSLDAISCASMFSSDKGRYLTAADVSKNYFEPWEDILVAAGGTAASGMGREQVLPLGSMYPPRMDVTRCTNSSTPCYDTADVSHYVSDTRATMPEIDAVTLATPPGDMQQSVLFSVPKDWAAGSYVAWIEVNLEGDYNDHWNATDYPTVTTPTDDWDTYSTMYGYAYRGQPSLVWKLPFSIGTAAANSFRTVDAVGRSSWNCWSDTYGTLETLSTSSSDPFYVTTNQKGEGTDRLRSDASGARFSINVRTGVVVAPPPPIFTPDAGSGTTAPTMGTSGNSAGDAGVAAAAMDAGAAPAEAATDAAQPGDAGDVVDAGAPATDGGAPGPIRDLALHPSTNRLRSYTWVDMRFRAAESSQPLHAYEVRVSTDPITDEASFITSGRQAKNATDSAEGATLLTLPTDVPAGQFIQGSIGDLVALTHYYVGVRATDELNQHGPISVAEITTAARQFATVSPCFVATAAYGSPLAVQVGVLRRLRDRYLLPQAFGRAFVGAYYKVGAGLARFIAPHPDARAAVRTLLSPLVAIARTLE